MDMLRVGLLLLSHAFCCLPHPQGWFRMALQSQVSLRGELGNVGWGLLSSHLSCPPVCVAEMAERHNTKQILKLARDLVYKVQTLIENK